LSWIVPLLRVSTEYLNKPLQNFITNYNTPTGRKRDCKQARYLLQCLIKSGRPYQQGGPVRKLDVSELGEGRELAARINELLRLIEEEGETIEITDKGKVVAHVVPTKVTQKPVDDKLAVSLRGIDELAAKIGASWKTNMDAVEAVRDVRRDL
jgi:antitoxin (DNA-binding transcriptional repressor) of toxin-antitoxin stability system